MDLFAYLYSIDKKNYGQHIFFLFKFFIFCKKCFKERNLKLWIYPRLHGPRE